MSIENIKSASQVSFSSTKNVAKVKKEAKTEQKGDKKKLALALMGLATAGVAAVGIAMNIKKGKIPTELTFDDFKKIGKFDKGQALVKGRPYTGIIEVVNKKGKYVKLKTTTAGKYKSKKKLKLKVICEIDVARYVSSNSKWYGN